MENILYTLLNVTVLSSAAILAVTLTKALFRNNIGAKAVSILWALVLLRLLVPVTIESPFKLSQLLPESKPVAEQAYTPQSNDNYFEDNINENNYDIFALGDVPGETAQVPDVDNISTLPEYNLGKTNSFPQRMKTFLYSIDISMTAFIVWLAVGTAFILMCVFNIIRFNSRLGNSVVVSKKLLEAFSVAKKNLNFGNKVKIAESKEVDMPITYGLIKPVIVIPEDMVAVISSRKLTLIIMHELMHIKRGDIFKNYLWLLAKAAHWFNPLVWIAYRMYLRDMEIVCDKMVIENTTGDERTEYSQSLLESARFMKRQNRVMSPAMLSFSEDRSKLRRRIMNILHPVKQSRRQVIALGLMIIVLVAGCFTTACTKDELQTENEYTPQANEIDMHADYSAEESQLSALMAEPEAISSSLFVNFEESRMIGTNQINVYLRKDRLERLYFPDKQSFPRVVIENTDIQDIGFTKDIVDYFIGDTYYKYKDTKSDIELEIEAFQKEVSKLGDIKYNQDVLDELLADLENDKKYASDENENANMEFTNSGVPESLLLKSYAPGSETKRLLMSDFKNSTDTYYGTYINYSFGDYTIGYSIMGMHRISDADLGIAFEESFLYDALRQANKMVDDLGAGMELSSIYVGKKVFTPFSEVYNEYDLYANSDDICYSFIYTPVTDGITSLQAQMIQDEESESYVFNISEDSACEYIRIVVDEDGVGKFMWRNKKDIVSYEENEFSTISMLEAVKVFKENVFEEKKIWSTNPGSGVTVRIEYIYLAMMPIESQDGRYVMTPVYAFKGTQSESHLESCEYIMLVNATDGSIIEN